MKYSKKVRGLCVSLITTLFVGLFMNTGILEAKAAVAHFDGNDYRMSGQVDEGFFDDDSTSVMGYTKTSPRVDEWPRIGIDVSHWQNDRGTIDWSAVRNSGVDFVIVKVGGRYNDGSFYTDKCYKQNIEGALAAGLRVGVYFWSEAVTEAEAREEANYVTGLIYMYNITLPICMDYEWCPSQYRSDCRLYNSRQNAAQRTAVANAFMNQCALNGYTGALYANKSTLRNFFDGDSLAANGRVWIANYSNPQWTGYLSNAGYLATTDYEKTYDFFQFSSQGSVPGITGYVDLDYWYDDGTISGQDYSAVFDATYYAEHNADVVSAVGSDAGALLSHFKNYGMAEGRQGCATFDPKSYYLQYGDLRYAYGTNWPLYYQHYMLYGKAEGRKGTGCTTMQGPTTVYNGIDYSGVYNYYYYLEHNVDVKNALGTDDATILKHFVNYGVAEGRQAIASFNVSSYRLQYADLRSAYGKNWKNYYLHYVKYGQKEGRKGTGCTALQNATTVYNGINYASVYDYNYYVNNNVDVKKAYGDDENAVLAHFVNYGMKEGRQAKSTFNASSYRLQYVDLRNAYGSNLKNYYLHYMNYGAKEGRKGAGCTTVQGATTVYNGVDYSAVYDYYYYVSNNSDIKNAYGNDDQAVLAHFVNYGMKEGRQAKADFNVGAYRGNYADLQSAYGNDLKSYYLHYMNFGKKEGRSGI